MISLMKKVPDVTVIILNYNGIEETRTCLKSILDTKYPKLKITVVDNGSLKNEAKILKKEFRNKIITFIRFKKNKGFTGGNNFATRRVKSKYIVLLNNDTAVREDWLEKLVKAMEIDSKIAVAQPKILLMNGKSFDYAGAAGGFIDRYGYPFTRGRIFNTLEPDSGQYDRIREIFWASGAAMIIRRSVIKQVGGLFDERFFNYMEEIDFCWRVWSRKFKVIVIPESVVYHKVAATAKHNLIKKRFWEHRNNLLLLLKNVQPRQILSVWPIRVILEVFTYFYYLGTGQPGYLFSLFFAHLDFLRLSPSILLTQKRQRCDGGSPFYPGSIVVDYFLKKRIRFKELGWNGGFLESLTITYLVWDTKLSGGNKIIFTHVNKLKERGHRLRLVSIFGPKATWFPLSVSVDSIFSYILNPKTDILVATFWPTAIVALFLPAPQKYYFIQNWERNFYSNPILKKLVLLTLYFPFKKITFKTLKAKLKKLGLHQSMYLILNAVDSIFSPSKVRKRRKDSKIKIISVVTKYTKYKGVGKLEKIIKKLKEDKGQEYEFTLVSTEPRPPSNNFDSFVSNPSQNRLVKLYQESDVFLHTSLIEGFPLPPLEAMASGCPVIATNSAGINEYAENCFNAIIVNDPDEIWRQNIIKKVCEEENLMNRLKKNGLETAERFCWEKIIDELEKIYKLQLE